MPNRYQSRTSPDKLRGEYYTPEELVRLIFRSLELRGRYRIVDPSCGDGSFLRGAVAAAAEQAGAADAERSAGELAARLLGFDINLHAVEAARVTLSEAFRHHFGVIVPPERLHVYPADVLRHPDLSALLEHVGAPRLEPDERLRVVGNPPYVEAKRLSAELKAELKARFPEATGGAPDLYLYFLHACLDWLRPGDSLTFVLPNKLMVNANAGTLRERLLREGRLRGLWLATQERLFGDAAVYPVVLHASAPRSTGVAPVERDTSLEVVRLGRDATGALVGAGTATADPGLYRATRSRALFPLPEAPVLRGALERLLRSPGRLDQVLEVRWTVSFHRAGLREQYVTREAPAGDQGRPFLGGGAFSGNGEVRRYGLEWRGWWIRYAEEELKRTGNPVPPLSLFRQPKVVICQNGRTLRAAYDDRSYVLKDTFLCGVPRKVDHPLAAEPRALVGLLCSRAVHFFYSHVFFGGHVGGGYLHFLRSFLVDVPLGEWTAARAEAVAALVRERETAPPAEWEALEERIEAHVSAALGLTAEEQEAVREWAARDVNWPLRERVREPASAQEAASG